MKRLTFVLPVLGATLLSLSLAVAQEATKNATTPLQGTQGTTAVAGQTVKTKSGTKNNAKKASVRRKTRARKMTNRVVKAKKTRLVKRTSKKTVVRTSQTTSRSKRPAAMVRHAKRTIKKHESTNQKSPKS